MNEIRPKLVNWIYDLQIELAIELIMNFRVLHSKQSLILVNLKIFSHHEPRKLERFLNDKLMNFQ